MSWTIEEMAGVAHESAAPLPRERVRRWLDDARAGDEAAFTALVEAHRERVFRTAYRLLGNAEDARDAAQLVFLRLHRNLARIHRDGSVEAWLYKVTINIARDAQRRAARRESLRKLWGARSESAQTAEGPKRIAESESRERLHALLRGLPPREREAIVLRDIEGLTTAEVAQALGTTENTVRSQISRGRLHLRKLHEERFPNER